MKGKSLFLLLLISGCGESVKVEWVEPDSSCHEIHDSSAVVDTAGEVTQTDSVSQPKDIAEDTTQTKD